MKFFYFTVDSHNKLFGRARKVGVEVEEEEEEAGKSEEIFFPGVQFG